MAAQEQQRERVVAVGAGQAGRGVDGEVSSWYAAGRVECRGGFAAAPGTVGAPCVGQRTAGDGQQPGPRPLGYSVLWPLQRRREQRLLHGVFTGVKLPVPTD